MVWSTDLSFFIAGRHCFAAGDNDSGQLGVGSDEETISIPTELPIPVDDIISHGGVTIIRSGNTLLACGDNRQRQLFGDFTTPTPLDLPGPVMKFIAGDQNAFVQTDGAWVGRGRYRRDFFIPADLDGRFISGWFPVTDEHAKKLDAQKHGNQAMFFPEPITNTRDITSAENMHQTE